MSTWSSLLIKQKTYEIAKLLPETEYTVSINGIYSKPIEIWLTALATGENGIVETEVNQGNAVYVGNLEYNKLTFTAQESHTALVIRTLGDLVLTTIKLEKGTLGTDWTPAPGDFNTLKGTRYSLSKPLQKDQYYTLSLEGEVDDFVGVWLGDDVQVGYLKDNKLTFKLTEQFNHDHIILKSLSENGIISKIKLEQDATSTSYSPAPEDGYNYPGEDCGYHIETSGGSNPLKLVRNLAAVPAGDLCSTSAQIHAFSKLLVRNNLGSTVRYLSGEKGPHFVESAGNGLSNFQFQFAGDSASESLDFVASSPIVIIGALDELPEVGDTMAISPVDIDKPLEYKTLNNHGQWVSMPPLGPLERSDFYSEYYPEIAGLWFEDRYNPNYTLKAKDLYGYHFDIIEGSKELSKFSVKTIGRRKEPVEDKDIKLLYPTQIDDVLVHYDDSDVDFLSYRPKELVKLTTVEQFKEYPPVGNVYKDAFSTIKANLFNHTSYNEQTSIVSLPLYDLEVNRRVFVQFAKASIAGHYLVKKINYNLDENGLMNISLIKINQRDM